MNKLMETEKKIERGVVAGYTKIEEGVVSGYKKIEDGVVSGYKKVEKKFVDAFLTPDKAENGEGKEDTEDGQNRPK